jgi:flagellar basal body-associated protein FliL
MQLKRILVSLLVAMMIISTGIIFASAEDAAVPTIAVETTSTADAEGKVAAKPGDTIEVNVVIKNNPGIALIQFAVKYDAKSLTLVDGKVDTKDGIFKFENALIGKNGIDTSVAGTITFLSDLSSSTDVKNDGKVATLKFKVGDKVDGDINVTVEEPYAFNSKFDAVALTPAALTLAVHSFGEPVVTAPTCTAEGYTTKTCANCKLEVKSDVVEATGHKEEVVAAVAPTCTEAGLTEGKKCSVCGEATVAQTEVPATGHKEEVVAAVAATCTETGLTEGKKCSVCGEATVAQTEVPAIGHKEETIPAVAATCTEAGFTEGKKCTVCGVVTVAQETAPVVDHTTEVVPGTAATCVASGLTDGEKCSVCGEVTKAQEVIPATGHTSEVIPATDTMTEGKKCSVCGTITVEPQPIAGADTETETTEVAGDNQPTNLTWLWIVIAVVVVIGAAAAVYFFVIKKKSK